MAEQWRDIAGYDGVYQVSDQGQVRNTQASKILQPVKRTGDYTSASGATDSKENAPFTAWSLLRFWATVLPTTRSTTRMATIAITKRPT